MDKPPPIQYVTTRDGYNLAYTVSGEGLPFVFMPYSLHHVLLQWEHSLWVRDLAPHFKFVIYDSRGQGLSTRGLPESPSIADSSPTWRRSSTI